MFESNDYWKDYWEYKGRKELDPFVLDNWAGIMTRDLVPRFIEASRKMLDLKKEDKLLEVGCGAGMLLVPLSKDVKEAVGVDISPQLIRLIPDGIKTYCAEANKLPFKDNEFDKVLCWATFHYFPDYEYAKQAIEEMKRVCKPGGKIAICDIPNFDKPHKMGRFRKLGNELKIIKKQIINHFFKKEKIPPTISFKKSFFGDVGLVKDQEIGAYEYDKGYRFNVILGKK